MFLSLSLSSINVSSGEDFLKDGHFYYVTEKALSKQFLILFTLGILGVNIYIVYKFWA